MFGVKDTMDQPTFADLEYDGKKRKTRREIFLERMDRLIPWDQLEERIRPFYPKAKLGTSSNRVFTRESWDQLEERIRPFYPKAGRGRRPYELSAMVRIHCVQLSYNLSDPGMEDMLYEVESVRRFVGLRLSGPLPDETTILNFRHLLEEHELGQSLFQEINRHLESQGLRLREGTIVDASIIEAPSSTKNRAGERDPEMRQTKKGNAWHFGMKVHIGADAETGVVHSVTTTPANVHDVTEALSDPGMEDMLYEVESVRRFVGLRLSGPLPDETTILNFRHLLEEHELGQSLFQEINRHLESQGLRLREGTIVDASIIEAPSSTKNRAGDRDPEMRQTKKGNAWHFGMKVHIGADAVTGVVHSVTTTPANVHDVTEAHRLLHGGEIRVWGDAGYLGVDKRVENRELGSGVAGGDEAQPAAATGARKRGGAGGEAQSVGQGESGASVPVCEAALWLRQGPLPGSG